MKLFPLVVAALAMSACATAPAIATQSTNNKEISIERLFDQDGCTVYRFHDGNYPTPRYFARCQTASASVSWQEGRGKNCVTDQMIATTARSPERLR